MSLIKFLNGWKLNNKNKSILIRINLNRHTYSKYAYPEKFYPEEYLFLIRSHKHFVTLDVEEKNLISLIAYLKNEGYYNITVIKQAVQKTVSSYVSQYQIKGG